MHLPCFPPPRTTGCLRLCCVQNRSLKRLMWCQLAQKIAEVWVLYHFYVPRFMCGLDLFFRHCRLHGCCPGLILRLLHCSEILMTVSSQPTAMMPCCTAWSIKILKYIHFMCLSVRKYSSSSFATPSVAHCCFALKTGWFLSLSSWLGYWERIILLSALVTGKPLVCTKNNWKSSEQI